MGLFTRFRTPSGSNPPPSSSNGRSTTPGPSSRVVSESSAPAPPRPSTSLGRQSTYYDSMDDGAPTPRPKEKEKRGFGWKGKAKADLGGKPYEEHQYADGGGPSNHAEGHGGGSGIADRRTKGERRITAIFTPHTQALTHGETYAAGPRSSTPSNLTDLHRYSPESPISPRSDRTVHSGSTERAKARTMSDEFAKDGGALGRLMFETEPAAAKSRNVSSWLVGSVGSGSGEDDGFDLMRSKERDRVGSMDTGTNSSEATHRPNGNRPLISPSISAPAGFYSQSNHNLSQPMEQLQQQQQNRFPPVPARKSSVNPLPPMSRMDSDEGSGQGSAISDGEDEGFVITAKEVGVGVKKGRFWVGKGRRGSKAAAEAEETSTSIHRATSPTPTPRKINHNPPVSSRPTPSQPGSPTARKSSLPPPPPPKGGSSNVSPVIPDQPLHSVPAPTARPPNPHSNLRRPSSSFFSNPFARTTSRTSVFTDIDSPVIDDGSFQLKGFRHVSGISQVDIPSTSSNGKVNGSTLGLADLSLADSPTTDNDKWDLPPPTRPTLTRPSSSASVRTFDSQYPESPKVSVAAFKKGIRRPSEGPGVHEGTKSALDDDDDVPLGVLNKGFARAKSSLSLSDQTADIPSISPALPISPSMGEMAKPSSQFTPSPRVAQLSQPPSREPSPGPNRRGLSPAQGQRPIGGGHQRNGGGSGGFVVRSAQSTKSTVSVESQRSGGAGAWSPGAGPSRSNSPMVVDRDQGREEIIVSPAELSPPSNLRDSYFASKPLPTVSNMGPMGVSKQDMIPPAPPAQHTSESVTTERNTNLPRVTLTDRPYPDTDHPKSPIAADGPGLHDLVLPPRPSEMPDDVPHSRSQQGQSNRSASAQYLSIAIPADFTRRISNFLAPGAASATSPRDGHGDDGFDPALVVNSMAAFSDETSYGSKPRSAVTGGRPSLQARLGQVAGGASGTKPSVARIDTDLPASLAVLGIRSPESDTATTPTIDRPSAQNTGGLVNGKAKHGRGRSRTISANGGKKDGWSSSESDDEDESPETDKETLEEIPASSFRKPIGPRSSPQIGRAITPSLAPTSPAKSQASTTTQPASIAKITAAAADDDGSDSSSEEETLAVIRARASKSTLALGTYSSTYGGAPFASSGNARGQSQPTSSMRGVRSPSSPNLSLSPPSSSPKSGLGLDTRLPKSSSSPRFTSAQLRSPPKASAAFPAPPNGEAQKKAMSPPSLHTTKILPSSSSNPAIIPPRRSPLSQSVSSTQLNHDASPPRRVPAPAPASSAAPSQKTASASPASSQSGLTGDSLLQPVTPRDSSVGAKPGRVAFQDVDKTAGHDRDESRDSLGQPMNGYGSGQMSSNHSLASMSPSTEERQRRFSQTSMPVLGPQVQQPAIANPGQQFPPNMDPAVIRNMMKQQWQAQFIAAAYQAAEEQWERASSVGGVMAGSESGHSAYSAFAATPAGPGHPMAMGMGMPPMPGYGYGYPQMGMGAPPQFMAPPQANYGLQGMGGYPPFAPQGGQAQGMYSYAPGAQSVYGGDFGPAVPQQPAFQPAYQMQYQHQQYLQQQQQLQQQQFMQQQSQQQPYPQQYPSADPSAFTSSPNYISSPLSQPVRDRPSSQYTQQPSESAAGPIRQRPRAGSRALSSQPMMGIEEQPASNGGGNDGTSRRPQPPVSLGGAKNRASSYNIGGSSVGGGNGMRPGLSSSNSASGLSTMLSGNNLSGGLSAPQPPPTSWRRSTASDWGGEANYASTPGQRKSRGGFAS